MLSVESFNLADHLNTAPELVDRVYNRPTLKTLETKSIQGAVEPHTIKVCAFVGTIIFTESTECSDKISKGKMQHWPPTFTQFIQTEVILKLYSSTYRWYHFFSSCRSWPSKGCTSIRSLPRGLTEKRKCLSSARKSRPVKTYR